MGIVLWVIAAATAYGLYALTVPSAPLEEVPPRLEPAGGEPPAEGGGEVGYEPETHEPDPMTGMLRGRQESTPVGTGAIEASEMGAGPQPEVENPFRPAHEHPDFKGSFDDIPVEPQVAPDLYDNFPGEEDEDED